MFTQKAKKSIAWLVAAVVCMACMGMVAVAEQNDSSADVQTKPEGQVTDAAAPAQDELSLVEIDESVESGNEVEGSGEALPLPEETLYLVTFYDLFGEVVGWADVPEGAYLLEMDGYPHVDGLVFEYWFDPALEEVVPYVFGTPIYHSFNLVPFYTIAPVDDGGAPKTGVYPELNDEQQVINMVEEILSAADENTADFGSYLPKQQVINDGTIDRESLLTDILGAGTSQTEPELELEPEMQTQEQTPESMESAVNVGEDTLFLLLDEDGTSVLDTPDVGEGEPIADADLGAGILDIEALDAEIPAQTEEENVEDAVTGEDASNADVADTAAQAVVDMPQTDETAQVTNTSDDMVLVMCFFEGESISLGEPVTLAAQLINFPEGANVTYQWQNNINGPYEDVPGATEPNYTFIADEQNVRCGWQVRTRY